MSYFERLGIIGWDQVEPVILGCILSNKAVLLRAPHGANKTEGCARISKAVFGLDSKFVPYDTSLVNADDLLGLPNPKKLGEGSIEFIKTPDSIWDATCALLDEINRCNPYNAAKFFEIVRSRTINGRETSLEFVWAACNPPDKYNTAHMDAAQVSRFVVLPVPTYAELTKAQQRKIMSLRDEDIPVGVAEELKDLMDIARKRTVPKSQERSIEEKTLKLASMLNGKNIEFSGRQVRDLRSLLMNMDRISAILKGLPMISEESMCDAIMGLVPETSGLIRASGTTNTKALRGEIATIMKGFKLSDPIMTAKTLVELAKAQSKDMQGWAAAFMDMLTDEDDPSSLLLGWQELTKRKDVPSSMFDTLRQSFAAKDSMLIMSKKGADATVAEVTEVLTESLKKFGPRSSTRPKGSGKKRKR